MPDGRNGVSDEEEHTGDNKGSITSRRTCIKAAGAVLGGAALVDTVSAESGELPDLLAIVSDRGKTKYDFSVGGDIEKNTEGGATVDDHDVIDGSSVSGHVWGGRDSYRFSGGITDFRLRGRGDVLLNGFEVDPSRLGGDLPNLLTIAGEQGDATYEFTVSGDLEPSAEAGATFDSGDAVDGSTASGQVGGGRDSYRFSGEVTEFSFLDGTATLYLDGTKVAPSELGGEDSSGGSGGSDSQTVEFSFASLTDETHTHYTVEVVANGSPVAVSDDPDVEERLWAESNDAVTQFDDSRYRIEGKTGTASGSPPAYGDTFRWETDGDVWGIEGFSYSGAAESDVTITINGSPVSPSELPARETDGGSGGGSGPAVGGGEGYANTIPQSEASAVVSTERELVDALDSAASGDIVYVAKGTTITANRRLTVPSGVTLASDRGIDGSPGGEIRTETELFPYVTAADGARIAGVRIRGPNPEHQEYDASLPISIGIAALGSSGVEIDNCEVSGFRYAGVRAGADTHVHHNHIHHCALGGLGYGVETNAGQPLIEYNYLNYTRHGVMSNGENGYTCRHNRFGPATMGHVIDVHSPGGTTVEIYNNTVEAAVYHEDATASWYPSGDPAVQVMLGGNPTDRVTIRDNWFYNDDSTGNAVVHNGGDWTNVSVENNHYGETEPASGDVGAPR